METVYLFFPHFSNILFAIQEILSIMKKRFLICGAMGWCVEVLWTGLNSLLNGKWKLIGQSSLWMFPIYGCAAFLQPISKYYQNVHVFLRGVIYMLHIFAAEFLFGSVLQKFGICPWDYSASPCHIRGVIRLDYAPLWFLLGLLYEKIFKKIP